MKYPYKLYQIVWDDAFSTETWQEVEALGADKNIHECLTVGFLVKEDDSHYYIATTVSGTQAACVMAVTKKMVKSFSELASSSSGRRVRRTKVQTQDQPQQPTAQE